MRAAMNATQVKKIRAALGLTGDRLGEMIGVTGNTVRRWECGARNPSGTAATLLRRLYDEVKRKE